MASGDVHPRLDADVGIFYAAFAAGNFLGPLLLGRLFDTVGRRPMIAAPT